MRLRPYPELVTREPRIKVYGPDARSPSNYVKALHQLPVTDMRYLPDQYGTKCNFLVHDVQHVMGYPVQYRLARQYIDDWNMSGSPIIKMVIQDAITNANLGCPTFFGLREPDDKHSHVGVVLPQNPTIDAAEVLVMQAGRVNFYGRQLKYAVSSARCADVQWFGGP